MSNTPIEEETLKEYILELFNQYDTERKGTLTFQQLNSFFNDLLKSVGANITYTYQQLYEVIYMCNPMFNGSANAEEVQKIFINMLSCGNSNSRPQQSQQQPQITPVYQYPQNMQTMGMQGQYINPMYAQYLNAQGQMQNNGQYGSQWGYGGYLNQGQGGWYRQ